MTTREAFITMCMLLAGVDEELHPKEVEKIDEILLRYGFSDDEIHKVLANLDNIKTQKEGFDLGVEASWKVSEMDKDMQKNLLQALEEIAAADRSIHPMESHIIQSVRLTAERI